MSALEHPVVNTPSSERQPLFLMWAGAYGSTKGYVWADHLEDAFEAWVEWLDDNAPGLLCTVDDSDYREAAKELGIDLEAFDGPLWEHPDIDRIRDHAEADLTAIGHTTLNHGTHIPSWEWGGDEVTDDSTRSLVLLGENRFATMYEQDDGANQVDELAALFASLHLDDHADWYNPEPLFLALRFYRAAIDVDLTGYLGGRYFPEFDGSGVVPMPLVLSLREQAQAFRED
jgi:hypothetical protein